MSPAQGAITHGRDLAGHLSLDADVVICGGGAGGSMAARELARAGLSVVLLEEGEDLLPSSFTQREEQMLPRLLQEMGGRRSDDMAVLILGGKGLGGSTLHNTNLCKRTAPEILTHWRDDLGVDGVGPDDLAPLFAEVERDLGVVEIAQGKINRHNALFRRGVEKLGLRGGVLSHNRDEACVGSGFCELGCAYDGKRNARRILIPQAVDAGAKVYTDARVERVVTSGARASGAVATLLDERGAPRGRLEVRARAVCLAGSAVGSAALALKSGLDDPHRQLGVGLRVHPACAIAGVFDERVDAWKGIPQSFECTELLDLRPGAANRVWVLPSFAHPVGTASISGGFGPSLVRQMRSYARTAALVAMVHDEAEGRVYLDGQRTRIRYEPTAADLAQIARGARLAARILLAAGASEINIPAATPLVARTDREIDAIDDRRFTPHDVKLSAVHPMGSLRMGKDPARSSVDALGRAHHTKGLWVVDGSLFPTSIGGPPQISIYTFAMRSARALARELSR